MKRRDFVIGSLVASSALGCGALKETESARSSGGGFTLKFAPHLGSLEKPKAGEEPWATQLGTFERIAGPGEISQLRFMHEAGFRAFEDNEMALRPEEIQREIAKEAERLGMQMGVFVANFGTAFNTDLPGGDESRLSAFLVEITNAVNVARRLNATWMTVVTGTRIEGLDVKVQEGNVVNALKRAAALLEPHGLVMVVEPLSWIDGDYLVNTAQQGYDICRQVDSPSCKLLLDFYHQQLQRGDLFNTFDKVRSEVAYIQVGDAPRRTEPTSGEIDHRNLFRHIKAAGYAGIVGMEHDASVASAQGERAVIDAYRVVDAR